MKPLLESIVVLTIAAIAIYFTMAIVKRDFTDGNVDHALIESLERQNNELIATVRDMNARDGISDQALVLLTAIGGIVFVIMIKMMLSARIEREKIRYAAKPPPPATAISYYSNPNGDLNASGSQYLEYHQY